MRSQLPLASIAYLRLVEQGASRVGALKKAVDAVEPVVMLALARHMLGKWPTQAEYAEAAEISERTAQRQWAAFKNAFPDEKSPEHFAKLLYAELGPRLDKIGPGAILSVPAPRELQPA